MRILLLLGIASFATPSPAADQRCDQVEILSPQGIVAERQPVIMWAGVSGAESYRIELESRVAEGKTLVQLDTRVSGTSFRPPQPLTDFRARVTVKVTPYCKEAAVPPSSVLRFKIDTSSSCRLLPEKIQFRRDDRHVIWEPVRQAVLYQVSLFGGAAGDLVLRKETVRSEFKLSEPHTPPLWVVIRPQCQAGWGQAVYQPLSP